MLITPDVQKVFIHSGKKPRCNRLAQTLPPSPRSGHHQQFYFFFFLIWGTQRRHKADLLVFGLLQKINHPPNIWVPESLLQSPVLPPIPTPSRRIIPLLLFRDTEVDLIRNPKIPVSGKS